MNLRKDHYRFLFASEPGRQAPGSEAGKIVCLRMPRRVETAAASAPLDGSLVEARERRAAEARRRWLRRLAVSGFAGQSALFSLVRSTTLVAVPGSVTSSRPVLALVAAPVPSSPTHPSLTGRRRRGSGPGLRSPKREAGLVWGERPGRTSLGTTNHQRGGGGFSPIHPGGGGTVPRAPPGTQPSFLLRREFEGGLMSPTPPVV